MENSLRYNNIGTGRVKKSGVSDDRVFTCWEPCWEGIEGIVFVLVPS